MIYIKDLNFKLFNCLIKRPYNETLHLCRKFLNTGKRTKGFTKLFFARIFSATGSLKEIGEANIPAGQGASRIFVLPIRKVWKN